MTSLDAATPVAYEIGGGSEVLERPSPVRDLDWESQAAREVGGDMLAIWEELSEGLRHLPIARGQTADDVAIAVTRPIPDAPLPREELMSYLRELALDWSMYPGHPGFMAYITGAGTVPGVAADLLAAALNQNLGAWRLSPAATTIELDLMTQFARRFGLTGKSGGILTSGGAMATFTGLKAARDAKAGYGVREHGLAGAGQLTAYASTQIHDVIDRAADMLGIGSAAVRHLPTDEGLRLRSDALRDAIEADLAVGHTPFAVIGTAGTVATGAIDPLDEIADICQEYGLWFHVDAAYGGVAALVESLKPQFAGIERAQSIAFDPHKWLYTPHSGGALVVADMSRLEKSFSLHPTYVQEDKELTRRGVDLYGYGPQFSRGFQGLKIWVSLLAHGWDAYERRIAHDVELAAYLHGLAAEHPSFESFEPRSLSIACFRYVPADLRGDPQVATYVDKLNERLMAEIQLDGRAYPSNAIIDGTFWLRACIVNFRTEAEDVERLLTTAEELGTRLDAAMRSAELHR